MKNWQRLHGARSHGNNSISCFVRMPQCITKSKDKRFLIVWLISSHRKARQVAELTRSYLCPCLGQKFSFLKDKYNVLSLIKIYIRLFWLSWSHYSVLTKNKNLTLKIVSWIAHIKTDPNETKTDSPAICSQSLKLTKFFIVKVGQESLGISRQVLILENGLGRSLFDRVVLVLNQFSLYVLMFFIDLLIQTKLL